jgi:hypothetical protein
MNSVEFSQSPELQPRLHSLFIIKGGRLRMRRNNMVLLVIATSFDLEIEAASSPPSLPTIILAPTLALNTSAKLMRL